jgi:uncharacterized membrane protein
MNNILIVLFDSERQAHEGVEALRNLDAEDSIVLNAMGMIAKDPNGTVTVRQAADAGVLGAAAGLVIGSVLGLFGGPAGVIAGAGVGAASGVVYDAVKFEAGDRFLYEVGQSLQPGKVAVVADVEEFGVTLVDTKLGNLGAVVFRHPRSEVVEDRLIQESAALTAEWKQLEEELRQANAENRAAVADRFDTVRQRLEMKRAEIEARLKQAKSEADARIAALQVQRKQASEERKAQIDRHIAEAEADEAVRTARLEAAHKNIVDTFVWTGWGPTDSH